MKNPIIEFVENIDDIVIKEMAREIIILNRDGVFSKDSVLKFMCDHLKKKLKLREINVFDFIGYLKDEIVRRFLKNENS